MKVEREITAACTLMLIWFREKGIMVYIPDFPPSVVWFFFFKHGRLFNAVPFPKISTLRHYTTRWKADSYSAVLIANILPVVCLGTKSSQKTIYFYHLVLLLSC